MTTRKNTTPTKWRSIIGLCFIYIALWFDWQWAWGILFLLWIIPDLFSGVTHFMEPIEKKDHPLLYWMIAVTWLLFSFLYLSTLFYPEWKYY